MYSFKTEVLGVEMDVTGSFYSEAFSYHYDDFEIWTISHAGKELDIDGIKDEVLIGVQEAAKKAADDDLGL